MQLTDLMQVAPVRIVPIDEEQARHSGGPFVAEVLANGAYVDTSTAQKLFSPHLDIRGLRLLRNGFVGENIWNVFGQRGQMVAYRQNEQGKNASGLTYDLGINSEDGWSVDALVSPNLPDAISKLRVNSHEELERVLNGENSPVVDFYVKSHLGSQRFSVSKSKKHDETYIHCWALYSPRSFETESGEEGRVKYSECRRLASDLSCLAPVEFRSDDSYYAVVEGDGDKKYLASVRMESPNLRRNDAEPRKGKLF